MIEFEEFKLQLDELSKKIIELGVSLDIENKKIKIEELEKEIAKDGFWDDLENSQNILKKSKGLKSSVEKYETLKTELEDLQVLNSLANEENDESLVIEISEGIKKINKKVEKITLETLLSGQYDKNNAILTLHSGAGGTEAQDWVEMLYRMYLRWAERNDYTVKELDYLAGEEAGIKSVTFLVEGENAYGYMSCEKGVHRLVRISPFDANKRRHTSFASLDVMPEITDDVEININPADLRVDTYRASGAGGQHVNKTESAVRITHIPTGVVVACQNERSQIQNRDTAMKMLKSKLIEIKEREHLDKIEDLKGDMKDIAWGSQIRSYVFHPYSMAKDHRTNYEIGNVYSVMDGEIDEFITAYLSEKAKMER
ncbi:MAG: peptide chain release factor 2 [Clostridiales bacterium]|nr:peptide chain release factor 2 [Clostridiales bacterium]